MKNKGHGGKREGAGRPRGQGKYGETTKPLRVPESLVEDVLDYSNKKGYKIPFFGSSVAAGYPSSSEDHIEEIIDMNRYLIKNPQSTFCVKVSGLSMIQSGIYKGDVLLVDGALEPTAGKVIVAALDGMLTVKKLNIINNQFFLIPDNPDFDPIPIVESNNLKIWGVVTHVLRSL